MKEIEVSIYTFHRGHRKAMEEIKEDLRVLRQDLAARKRSRTSDAEVIISADSETPRSPSPK